jgi:O-antigen/teichoic acid export membrane protein
MVGLIIASPKELTFVLLDERFSQASQYVLWGALAEAARVIVGTYALSAHAGMNTKKLMLPNTIAAIAAPAIIFMLIGAWGVEGVGLGLVVAGGIAIVSNHVILSKSFHIIMPWMEIVRAIAIAALFLAVSMLSHSFWGEQVTWGKSLVWLGSLGALLFIALYFMLKDAIYREVEH